MDSDQIFKLPDGTEVATGNLLPDTEPLEYLASENKIKYLEKDAIQRLLGNNKPANYKIRRRAYQKWMINQGSIGKCNASAAVGACHLIRERNGHRHEALADNYLYALISGGQDRGSLLHDGMREGQKGIAPRRIEDVGEISHNAFNKNQIDIWDEAQSQARRFRMHEPMRLPENFEDFKMTVATALALRYPIVMAWHVGNSSMRLRNGYTQCGRGPGNHASLLHAGKWIGGQDIVHADLQNSWGPTADPLYGKGGSGWGENGYGLITMDDLYACRRYHDYYVITGFSEDPYFDPQAES